jgi:membrane protease YdiL (CAAX protease family)
VSPRLIGAFYGAMLALGLLIGWLADLPWPWLLSPAPWPLPAQLAAGAAFGLLIVALSRVLTRRFEWASALDGAMRELLGRRTAAEVAWMALMSGVGEEWLFRGALQPALTGWIGSPWLACALIGLAFGALHIGQPLRTFWPWTVMAVVMGWCMGALTIWSGSFIPATIAHITINGLNLRELTR